jgi:LysR family transcriptional activator of nhaA
MQKQYINYQHLLYFMTIAVEGSVAKASLKLKLGQSTLSTQLMQFENQLGLKLFERRQQRLHITEVGRIALQYAREIFKMGDEMTDALYDRRQMHRISVQIGALDVIPKALVVELVAAAQHLEACSTSVVEGHADELIRALKAHEIDLALLNYQPPATDCPELTSRIAVRSPIVILGASKFFPLAKGFPQSLEGQPFVMPGMQSRLRHDLDNYFKRHRIRVDMMIEAQDSSLLTLFAAQGTGLMPVSLAAAGELQAKFKLRNLGAVPDVHDELWLVRSERKIENPVAMYLFKNFKLHET